MENKGVLNEGFREYDRGAEISMKSQRRSTRPSPVAGVPQYLHTPTLLVWPQLNVHFC